MTDTTQILATDLADVPGVSDIYIFADKELLNLHCSTLDFRTFSYIIGIASAKGFELFEIRPVSGKTFQISLVSKY